MVIFYISGRLHPSPLGEKYYKDANYLFIDYHDNYFLN